LWKTSVKHFSYINIVKGNRQKDKSRRCKSCGEPVENLGESNGKERRDIFWLLLAENGY